jgi:phosphatidate phosphatase APP1
MSFPEDRVGDGDGLSGLRVSSVSETWIDDHDVLVADQSLSSLLWSNIESKFGRRQDLPGTRQRCRILAFDTQEVSTYVHKKTLTKSQTQSLTPNANSDCPNPNNDERLITFFNRSVPNLPVINTLRSKEGSGWKPGWQV